MPGYEGISAGILFKWCVGISCRVWVLTVVESIISGLSRSGECIGELLL